MMIRLVMIAATACSLGKAETDPWTPVRVFEGTWEGAASGEPGKGTSTRTYAFELNNSFLVERNKSVYEPKKAGEKPEVHEDFGVFSYDRNSKKLILRQFHGEGFVNEYALEHATPDSKSFQFVSQRIENIAPGWRAKEAYRVISEDEVEESFSLAAPGKNLELYSRTLLKRIK